MIFKKISSNSILNTFSYNIKNNICKSENCDKEYINYFLEIYCKNLEIN